MAHLPAEKIPLRALCISLRAKLARDRLHERDLTVGKRLLNALGFDPSRVGPKALRKLALGAGGKIGGSEGQLNHRRLPS